METTIIEIIVGFGLAIVVAYLISIFHRDIGVIYAVLVAWFLIFGIYIAITHEATDTTVRRPTVVHYETCIEGNHCTYNRV